MRADSLPMTKLANNRNREWLIAGVIFCAAIAIRLCFFSFESRDYKDFLSGWYDHFVTLGRWYGLGQLDEQFASYPPLYMTAMSLLTLLPIHKLYAIKLLSISFDFVACVLVYLILRKLGTPKHRSLGAAGGLLFLPTIIMNGAVWGQCDMMYTTCFLWFFYAFLKGREVLSLIAYGFAVSLKPQAIFLAPVIMGLIISRQIHWKYLFVVPSVYLIVGLPEVFAGRPFLHVLLHWLRVENMPGLSLGAPNWYQWVSSDSLTLLRWIGIGLCGSFCTLVVAQVASSGITKRSGIPLLLYLLLSFTVMPFLLPGMHERYFFAADIFSYLLAVVVPKSWPIAVSIQTASALSYIPFLYEYQPVPYGALALLVVAAIGGLTYAALLRSSVTDTERAPSPVPI